MRRRPSKLWLRPGTHLAMKDGRGNYRPAMVLEDGGGNLVKLRYVARGQVRSEWVPRADLIPPPWIGCRRPIQFYHQSR